MTDQFVVAHGVKSKRAGYRWYKKARADLGGQAPAFTKQPRITIRYAQTDDESFVVQPSVSDVVASPGGVYAEKRPDIGFEPPEPHSGLSDQKRSSERGKAQRIPIEGQIERRFLETATSIPPLIVPVAKASVLNRTA